MDVKLIYFKYEKEIISCEEEVKGLTNDTSCSYMNCTIQALFATKKFYNHTVLGMRDDHEDSGLWTEMAKLFINMKYSVANNLDPTQVFNYATIPDPQTKSQRNPAEYLRYLLHQLQVYERGAAHNIPDKKNANAILETSVSVQGQHPSVTPSSIMNIFGGKALIKFKCSTCKSITHESYSFTDLRLKAPKRYKNTPCCIQTLVRYHFSHKHKCNFCDKCNSYTITRLRTVLESPPEHLILVLEDYRSCIIKRELNITANNNIILTMPAKNKFVTYEMYAVVIYSTLYGRNQYFTAANNGNKWYAFVDEHVSEILGFGLDRLKPRCYPHIIFCKRIDVPDVPAPGLDQLSENTRQMLELNNRKILDEMRISLGYKKLNTNNKQERPEEEGGLNKI